MPIIDKKVNLNRMKKNTPEFYIWMNNVIACSITQNHIKEIVKHKCPKLKMSDAEISRNVELYKLLNKLRRINVHNI